MPDKISLDLDEAARYRILWPENSDSAYICILRDKHKTSALVSTCNRLETGSANDYNRKITIVSCLNDTVSILEPSGLVELR